MNYFIDLFLNLDTYLGDVIAQYGIATYLILFLIIFLETGVVITPFLPGDSLIFAASAFAAMGSLNIVTLFLAVSIAAILGDSLNYFIGRKIGKNIRFSDENWILKQRYLTKTEDFYKKYGGKTIVIARFVPIVRTFAPFVAGVAKMPYSYFLTYNILGGILWTGLFSFGGYLFGNIPFVKEHFSIAVIIIIILSFVPIFIELFKKKKD